MALLRGGLQWVTWQRAKAAQRAEGAIFCPANSPSGAVVHLSVTRSVKVCPEQRCSGTRQAISVQLKTWEISPGPRSSLFQLRWFTSECSFREFRPSVALLPISFLVIFKNPLKIAQAVSAGSNFWEFLSLNKMHPFSRLWSLLCDRGLDAIKTFN